MDMDSCDRSEQSSDKDFTMTFKVFEHYDPSKKRHFLKLAKPDAKPGEPSCEKSLELGRQGYPNVCVKRECVGNTHALNIMCSMNHQNIVSLKGIGPVSQDSFIVFIEECDGEIWTAITGKYYDGYGRIPSNAFQAIVSQIIEGVDFLRRNYTYHDTDDAEEGQWQDWIFVRQMLEYVSAKAVQFNQNPERHLNLHCAEIDALIELIRGSDRTSLHQMRNVVLDDVFFWKSQRRTRFMTTTIAELMPDFTFHGDVEASEVCDVPWTSNDINGSLPEELADRFAALLDHCNEYRAKLRPRQPALDPDLKVDCVRLAYIAYTHQHQEDIKAICRGLVDRIFVAKYPKLFIELNRIKKARGEKRWVLCHEAVN